MFVAVSAETPFIMDVIMIEAIVRRFSEVLCSITAPYLFFVRHIVLHDQQNFP
jgi:hypothetical protein